MNVTRLVACGLVLAVFMYFANRYAMRNYDIPDGTIPIVIIFFLIAGYIAFRSTKRKKHDKGRIYRDTERHYFSEYVKTQAMAKQHNKCAECNQALKWFANKLLVDWDHIDGNHSNTKENNCQGLCPACHAIKTRTSMR